MLFFQFYKHVLLIKIRKTFLLRFPRCLALIEEIIIKPATTVNGLIQLCGLGFIREYSIFE